ncbi:hypothetical protein KUTeg_024969 [Tegillarca granosa]|uniref:Uncharacterized protein n=1 Tax=Tegillarca granosa TaxID=220873 RepID=A0ABQ9E551_TEGGR|nr:hypothetical protein KUTeg_024969 [Tegillarca granosa]
MGYDNKLPGWILTWFYVTAVICTWDASFIMCRPHSLPGGSLAYIWYFLVHVGGVVLVHDGGGDDDDDDDDYDGDDYDGGDDDDDDDGDDDDDDGDDESDDDTDVVVGVFCCYKYYVVVDQRYNDVTDAFVFAQSLLNYVEVLFNVITIGMHYWNARHTRMLAFTVTVMTFWKTVLYFLMFTEFCGAGHYRVGITLMQEIFIFAIPNGVWILVPFLALIKLWSMLVNPTVQVEEKNGFTGYNQHAYVPVQGKKHI